MEERMEWSDGTIEFDRGAPSGIGDRWIVMGCGSKENGWMEPLFKIWMGDSTLEDYHGNMNSILFKKWIDEYFLNAEDRSVLVIDRAPYHMQLTNETRKATTSMNRGALAQWLVDHNATDETGILFTVDVLLREPGMSPNGQRRLGKSKQELYKLCREMDPNPKYLVQAWFDRYNENNPDRDLKLLILPVACPWLNPIEKMWGQQKQYVRANNFSFTMSRVKELVLEKFNLQRPIDWEKQYEKMVRYAVKQWEADEILIEEQEGGGIDIIGEGLENMDVGLDL